MADRLKYFVLGTLFLVVAGVIAYDKWNADGRAPEARDPDQAAADTGADAPFTFEVGDETRSLEVPDDDGTTGPDGRRGEVADRGAPDFDRRERDRALPPVDLPDPGPAPRPTPPDTEERTGPPPSPPVDRRTEVEPRMHVVRSGETLEIIAKRYFGTRKGIEWIVEANGLRNKNLIFVNQKLVIPASRESTSTDAPASAPSGARAAAGAREAGDASAGRKVPSVYVVKPGETDLYKICRRFYGSRGEGARVARVMEMNQLWSAEVKPGTRLRLPPE